MRSLSTIRRILGKPYFETEDCQIYNLDCLEAMLLLNNQTFDLTITSPPYNIGKSYESIMGVSEYIDWCSKWISEIYRITRDDGGFWLNLGYLSLEGRAKAIPIPYLLWDKVEFYLMQEVVWHYAAGVAAKKYYSPRNEKFLWYVKNPDCYTFNLDSVRDPNVKYPNQKKNGKIKVNPLGKNPSDVWIMPKVTSGAGRSSSERTPHPAQFPIQVIDRIIRASSNEGELLLDPFMGSGTTADVALNLKRKIIGFEINSSYCDIIANRLENGMVKLL
jgi:adenine-specific DNA-methyltransferase